MVSNSPGTAGSYPGSAVAWIEQETNISAPPLKLSLSKISSARYTHENILKRLGILLGDLFLGRTSVPPLVIRSFSVPRGTRATLPFLRAPGKIATHSQSILRWGGTWLSAARTMHSSSRASKILNSMCQLNVNPKRLPDCVHLDSSTKGLRR